MARSRPALSGGTPDFSNSDLPGTAFLLKAAGRLPDGVNPRNAAWKAHRTALIDRDRRVGARAHSGAAARRLRGFLMDNEVRGGRGATIEAADPRNDGTALVEAREAAATLLSLLTPEEATLLRWRAVDETPVPEIAARLGVSTRTIESRWAALRARARALLSISI